MIWGFLMPGFRKIVWNYNFNIFARFLIYSIDILSPILSTTLITINFQLIFNSMTFTFIIFQAHDHIFIMNDGQIIFNSIHCLYFWLYSLRWAYVFYFESIEVCLMSLIKSPHLIYVILALLFNYVILLIIDKWIIKWGWSMDKNRIY